MYFPEQSQDKALVFFKKHPIGAIKCPHHIQSIFVHFEYEYYTPPLEQNHFRTIVHSLMAQGHMHLLENTLPQVKVLLF